VKWSLIFIIVSLLFGCRSAGNNQPVNLRWGIGDDFDLPARFESVCGEDERRCGDTHIDDFGAHTSVSFERFETAMEADAALQRERGRAGFTLRSGPIKNQLGEQVGEKWLILIDSKRTSGEAVREYSLLWTRGTRFAQIWSESFEAIERYELNRGL
jgi:hypothetical protein